MTESLAPTSILSHLEDMDAAQPHPADAEYDARAFIRVLGEELVNAGYRGGDRTVILANFRAALASRSYLLELLRNIEAAAARNNGPLARDHIDDKMRGIAEVAAFYIAKAEADKVDR